MIRPISSEAERKLKIELQSRCSEVIKRLRKCDNKHKTIKPFFKNIFINKTD